MELCAAPAISSVPHQRLFTPGWKSWAPKVFLPSASLSGSRYYTRLALRSSMSDEYAKDEPDAVVIMEDTRPNVIEYIEDMQNNSPEDLTFEENKGFELILEKLIQFGSGDTFSALLLGFAALWTLYFTIALVNAMDSVPLMPKAMEVVGLFYTIWFTSRYLILQKSRKELADIVEDIKNQVLG